MAITLTTSAQVIGSAQNNAWKAELLGWYSGKSGNTATVHVVLRVTYIESGVYEYYGTNKGYSLNFNGESSSTYASTMYNGTAVNMAERTQSMSGGSTIYTSGSWWCYSYSTLSVSPSQTVSLPQFIIAPTTPTLNIVNDNAHQNSITYGTSSFGNPSTGTVKLYVADNPGMTSKTLLETKTTTGLFTCKHTSLTADTAYYYQVIADNSQASSTSTGNVTTRMATYVPDSNDETILVQKLLVPYNGLSKYVVKLYRGDSNNEAERIY